MCLAIPAKVLSIENEVADCSVGDGESKVKASMMLLAEDVQPGDYLIIHAGFAIRKLDLKEAEESLNILRDLARMSAPNEHEELNF